MGNLPDDLARRKRDLDARTSPESESGGAVSHGSTEAHAPDDVAHARHPITGETPIPRYTPDGRLCGYDFPPTQTRGPLGTLTQGFGVSFPPTGPALVPIPPRGPRRPNRAARRRARR